MHVLDDLVMPANHHAAEKATLREIAAKQAGRTSTPGGAATSAPKRVVLKIVPEKIASWDHTKLDGTY